MINNKGNNMKLSINTAVSIAAEVRQRTEKIMRDSKYTEDQHIAIWEALEIVQKHTESILTREFLK